MGISRLREQGEIRSWECDEKGRNWEKMRTESRQKPETIVAERIGFILRTKGNFSSEISMPFLIIPSLQLLCFPVLPLTCSL